MLHGTPGLKSLAKRLYEPQAGLWISLMFGHPQCSFPAQILALPQGRVLLPLRPAAFSLDWEVTKRAAHSWPCLLLVVCHLLQAGMV